MNGEVIFISLFPRTHKNDIQCRSEVLDVVEASIHLLVGGGYASLLGLDREHPQVGKVLPGVAAKHALQVADKAVDVALASGLLDDVLVVVVPQAAGQLLVVHLGLVLAEPPATGHLQRRKQS